MTAVSVPWLDVPLDPLPPEPLGPFGFEFPPPHAALTSNNVTTSARTLMQTSTGETSAACHDRASAQV